MQRLPISRPVDDSTLRRILGSYFHQRLVSVADHFYDMAILGPRASGVAYLTLRDDRGRKQAATDLGVPELKSTDVIRRLS